MSKSRTEVPTNQAAQVRKIELSAIRADERAQPRAALSVDRVAEYVEDMGRGDKFPPLIVFHDDAGGYWLADGFHRYHAAVGLEWKTVECDVRKGELRDAILFSCGTNAAHGIRRSNDDKRQAVTKLLMDEEWGKWSDREIARRCHVGPDLVDRIREQLRPVTVGNDGERTYRTKHGTTATMKTDKVGRRAKPAPHVAAAVERAVENQRRQAAGNAADPAASAEQRKAEAAEAEGVQAEPSMTLDMISTKTGREQAEAFMRQHAKKMEAAMRQKEAEIREQSRVEHVEWFANLTAEYRKKEEHYEIVSGRWQGLITKADYNNIMFCIHPDQYMNRTDAQRNAAQMLWHKLESKMVKAEHPLPLPSSLPGTREELLKRKAEYDAQRKAARDAAKAKREAEKTAPPADPLDIPPALRRTAPAEPKV
jgi:ParB-like nuclease domain